jgi:hypothetical protein
MTALIIVVAVVVTFEVCCLVDVARAKEVRRLDRQTWALICLVTLPLGGVLYLSLGKKGLRRTATSRTPPRRSTSS